jgi:hypothetical protein
VLFIASCLDNTLTQSGNERCQMLMANHSKLENNAIQGLPQLRCPLPSISEVL